MAYEYYDSEVEIKDALVNSAHASLSGVDIMVLPEDDSEYTAPDSPRVTVQFIGSQADKTKSIDSLIHPEEISIALLIESRKLRSAGGVHQIARACKEILLGKKMAHARTDLYFKGYQANDPVRNSDTGFWAFILEVGFRKMFTQVIVEDIDSLPKLDRVDIIGAIGGNSTIQNNG